MAVDDNGAHAKLRTEIRRRLDEMPRNETMHQIFREVVDRAERT